MKGLQFNTSSRATSARRAGGVIIESLESRRLLSADLAPLFVAKLPAAFPTEGKPQVTVRLVNTGDLPAKGSAHIELFASTDGALGVDDILLASANKKVKLKPSGGVPVKLKVPLASHLPAGSYTLIARVSGAATLSDANSDNNVAIAPAPVAVQDRVMDLAAQFAQIPGDPVGKGHDSQELAISVTNVGNVTAKGTVAVTWYLSKDTTLDANDIAIAGLPAREIRLVPGHGQVLQMRAVLPANTPLGTYYVLGKITPGSFIHDTNPANDIAVTPTPVAIIKAPTVPSHGYGGYEFVDETYYLDNGGTVDTDTPTDDGTVILPDDGGTDPGVDTTPPQTDPTTDPATDPTTQPTTDPTTQPTTDPSTEPDVPPVSDPAPSTQPSTDPDPTPAPDPTPTPAPDPPATTDTNYGSSGGDF